ncbi:Uncharacterised protein [Klebsiella pneumoniae]|nr:Uncharacterised protein [Klebsiella pneumoniae]
MLIVAVIITKGRDAIFQKTGQFKITTETRSADSDDVNSVFLRCPAIQAAIKGLDQNKLSIPLHEQHTSGQRKFQYVIIRCFHEEGGSLSGKFIHQYRPGRPEEDCLTQIEAGGDMAAVCGNKHLRLPFSGKLINQPLHTDMAEMIFRLLKQQYVELSLLLMPLQRKLRFDEALPSFSTVTNGNTVLGNVQIRLKP